MWRREAYGEMADMVRMMTDVPATVDQTGGGVLAVVADVGQGRIVVGTDEGVTVYADGQAWRDGEDVVPVWDRQHEDVATWTPSPADGWDVSRGWLAGVPSDARRVVAAMIDYAVPMCEACGKRTAEPCTLTINDLMGVTITVCPVCDAAEHDAREVRERAYVHGDGVTVTVETSRGPAVGRRAAVLALGAEDVTLIAVDGGTATYRLSGE